MPLWCGSVREIRAPCHWIGSMLQAHRRAFQGNQTLILRADLRRGDRCAVLPPFGLLSPP
jgi:hypothetical protein